MSTWIVYSLVIVFFLALLIVVAIATREPGTSTRSSQDHTALTHENKISYAVIAAIFTLIIALTLFIRRERLQHPSREGIAT